MPIPRAPPANHPQVRAVGEARRQLRNYQRMPPQASSKSRMQTPRNGLERANPTQFVLVHYDVVS